MDSALEFDSDDLVFLQRKQPEMVLIGNSMVFIRLDVEYLQKKFQPMTLEMLANGGARSLQWLLWLKNYATAALPAPKVVFIFHRDFDFHDISFRTTGSHLDQIRHTMRPEDEPHLRLAHSLLKEPTGPAVWLGKQFPALPLSAHIQKKLRQASVDVARLMGPGTDKQIEKETSRIFANHALRKDVLEAGAQDNVNANTPVNKTVFSADPRTTYLPEFIKAADAVGTKIVFYRIRRRPNENNEPPSSKYLDKYTASFKQWVESCGHYHIDESADARITADMYNDGDHLLESRAVEYSDIFVERVKSLIPTPFTPEEKAAGKRQAAKFKLHQVVS